MLVPMIDEARLERENQPSAVQRLLQQPNVLAVSGVSIAAAVVMFVLAAQPQLWLSPDLSRYNRAVQSAQVSEEPESADAAVGFQ